MKKKNDYYDEDFCKMLDARCREYERTGISVSEKEVNRRIKKLIATKKAKRKS